MSPDYQSPIYSRLEPRTQQFKGGRITDTDVLTLDEAAKYASKHADKEITPGDFLRAAARGEITLRAIVHREAKLQKYDGGIYCNLGLPTENTAPKGAILTLPLSACSQLANAGRASWRTFDGFEHKDTELKHFTVATLIDSEPDFETVPTDCRVMGDAVHALADEYIDTPTALSGATEKAAPPVPVVPPAAADDDGWQANALRLADEIGLKKWNRGERLFSVRSISESVAAELGKGTTNNPTVWWGTQGPRSAGAIRTALKGWQFTPPNSGTNGTSCT